MAKSNRILREPSVLLVEDAARLESLRLESNRLPSWDVNATQACDLELLLNGAFSPLTGYLSRADYESVLDGMRLVDGTVWPLPIVLDVTESFASEIAVGGRIALRHPEGMCLAILTVSDVWRPDRAAEAEAVFRTTDEAHPGVFHLAKHTHPVYLGGRLEGLELPPHHTFTGLRFTPRELREAFRKRGWNRVVGFQTRNPLHRAHVELTLAAARDADAHLLLHPVVGRTSPGDVDYFTRVSCYQAVLGRYPRGLAMLGLLPLAMRMAGPREAVWHAIIRRNFGCTHFIVGRHHASPGANDGGLPWYGAYEAQALVDSVQDEIGIEILSFEEMVYCDSLDEYVAESDVPAGVEVLRLSGTELRRRLREGAKIPDWFSYPEVIHPLRVRYPARALQGFTVFFTGLSGSGKSTIARILMAKLMEIDTRPVTLLDGDIVRKNLSSELGFSREHRDLNIRRIGFVASEITKNRGVAICAPIAPFRSARRDVRELISGYGGFVEVHVATPLETCEQRDRKGLYARARAGLITGFTGIDDPYETPENAELVIDTTHEPPEESAQRVVSFLEKEGYFGPPGTS